MNINSTGMTSKIKYLIIFLLFVLLSFTACQDEATEVISPNDQEALVANSPLANLMRSTSGRSGVVDNILDGSSCFSVELPVTIVVSDITITIETEADLVALEDLLEALEDDEDFLDFVFPITIIFSDYTELVIENEGQLENFINECDVADDPIECVNFVYPVTFSVFNLEFNLIDVVVVENDEALYGFLDELEGDENALIVSLNYPVSLEYDNGEVIEVNTNQELADAIEAAGDDCDDDDDDDDDDESDCDDEYIELALKQCQWELVVYSSIPEFQGVLLEFNSAYTFDIILDENQILTEDNTWSVLSNTEGSFLVLDTAFEGLGGDWQVIACDDDRFEFTKNNQNMVVEQFCEGDLECSITDISSILQECPWDFTDGSGNFENDQMIFSANGGFEIDEGMPASAIGGNWNLSATDNGIVITFSELTAFQNDLGGDWLIIECDNDRIVLNRENQTLVLEQDCEGDLGCSVAQINANILECAWELETNLIASVSPIYVYFGPNGQVLSNNNNNNNTENQIGTWDIGTIASGVFIEFTFQAGFEVLDGQWQIVECDDGELYLVNGPNYMSLNQDCDLVTDAELFNCFDDFELVECEAPNNVPVYNLSGNTIGLITCTAPFTPSFHTTLSDAENNTSPIENTEAYGTLTAQVYLRIEAESGNFEIFNIYLNTEACNLFECFQSFDAIIERCDLGNDGIEVFDLTIAFANCTPSADSVVYYETEADAESGVNPISNLEAYTNNSIEQYIYVSVEIDNQFEVFTIQLRVIDCNSSGCSEDDVDAFLLECIWNALSYNGSDNLMEWNFNFESTNQIVVIYTETQTIDASWSTSQSNAGVHVEFSNIAGPNIQAITGSWLVVECTEARLELNKGEDVLVLERNCD
jgi:hypothetical protein